MTNAMIVKPSAAGSMGPAATEVFNDYNNNIAGIKGYYFTSFEVDTTNNTIATLQLSTQQSNFNKPLEIVYALNDMISYVYGGKHYNVAKITDINQNDGIIKIQSVNNEPLPIGALGEDLDDQNLFVLSKPKEGAVTFGHYAHAEGHNNKAYGWGSHSEGRNNIAIGGGAHTEGRDNEAYAYGHAEGRKTKAIGSAAHAEGYQSIASGEYSHAENQAKAYGNYSHAENNGKSYGSHSHAEGNSTAEGNYSHAEGYDTKASGAYGHAEGMATKANGVGGHSEGYLSQANGEYSHAEGYSTQAIGNYGHTEGRGSIVNGAYSHAEGFNTDANGDAAHAEGLNSVALGNHSHAEGEATQAVGIGAHSEGWETRAVADYSHAQGRWNIVDSEKQYAHIVGNGDGVYGSGKTRSNAYTLDWDGNGWFAGNITVGPNKDKVLTSGNVVEKEEGKGLSTNDFTDEYKNKLDNLTNEIIYGLGTEVPAEIPTGKLFFIIE